MTLPEGRWLKATTFRVSDRQVVHHILSGTVDVDHKGDDLLRSPSGAPRWAATARAAAPTSSRSTPASGCRPPAAWASRTTTRPTARRRPRRPRWASTSIPRAQEPKYVLRTFLIFDFSIEIPAGEEFHKETSYIEFPKDAILYGITPARPRARRLDPGVDHLSERQGGDAAGPAALQLQLAVRVLPEDAAEGAGGLEDHRQAGPTTTRPATPATPTRPRPSTWASRPSEEMMATYLHYRWADETVAHQTPEHEKALQRQPDDGHPRRQHGRQDRARRAEGRRAGSGQHAEEVLRADRHQPRRRAGRPRNWPTPPS